MQRATSNGATKVCFEFRRAFRKVLYLHGHTQAGAASILRGERTKGLYDEA